MIAWYWSVVAFILGIVFATVSWNAVEWDNILSAICAWLAIPFVYVAMFPHHLLEKCGKACFSCSLGMFPEVECRGRQMFSHLQKSLSVA